MTDPIADFFTRIKNGYHARQASVSIPHSSLKQAIAEVLSARRLVGDVEKKGRKVRKFLEIGLRYEDGAPALTGVKLLSRSSRRLYAGKSEIRPVRQGFGMLIISTSKGVMSGEDARKAGTGGTLIAEVW